MTQTVLTLFWASKLAERDAALRLAWAALRPGAQQIEKKTAQDAIAALLRDLHTHTEKD